MYLKGAVGISWNSTRGMNNKSIAIALIDNYCNSSPLDRMLEVTQKIIDFGKDMGFVSYDTKIHGHRDHNQTECQDKRFKSLSPGKILREN